MIQKTFKGFLSAISLAFIAAAMISGCSSSTTTTPPTTTTNVTPKDSSKYTYTRHEIDSTSGKPATSPQDTTIIAVVVSSGLPYQGKNNVVTVYDDFDTLRYSVESNNDISFYRASFGSNGYVFKNPSPWLTLPFGSKLSGDTLFTTKDSILVQGIKEYISIVGVADYIGTDQVSINGTKLASGNQVRLTITVTGISPLPLSGISSTQTYSFDGSIGNYFHSISKTIFPDVTLAGLKGSTTFTEKILTSYNLK